MINLATIREHAEYRKKYSEDARNTLKLLTEVERLRKALDEIDNLDINDSLVSKIIRKALE